MLMTPRLRSTSEKQKLLPAQQEATIGPSRRLGGLFNKAHSRAFNNHDANATFCSGLKKPKRSIQ